MKKFIFITGGVVSSLGKGITSASVGLILKLYGFTINFLKIDPYLNVDPGTMSPYQHGEVYVTSDGAETDLDLGHYERFTGVRLTKKNNITAGRIYLDVIEKERRGDYLGKTVQIVPTVTDEIKKAINRVSENTDITIVEIGGTVGDIEGLPFLEAIRQMKKEAGYPNTCYMHLTYLPFIRAAEEYKTKPTQHSVQKLREIGIIPDILIIRAEEEVDKGLLDKIAMFTSVEREAVISEEDVCENIYKIPVLLEKHGLGAAVLKRLGLKKRKELDFSVWNSVVNTVDKRKKKINIAISGKYTELKDSYKSIVEALRAAGARHGVYVETPYFDVTREFTASDLKKFDGVIVPGGFGERGVEGKIKVCEIARKNNIPFLGICLGMQCAVIEFARNVCGLKRANSTEFSEDTAYPVITLLESQKNVKYKGNTMRLGEQKASVLRKSRLFGIYGTEVITERHRHRYEVNPDYFDTLEKRGLLLSGRCLGSDFLIEAVELKKHKFYVAVQYHPEFSSTIMEPNPLFTALVRAAAGGRRLK